MNTRIRYGKSEDGAMISKRVIATASGEVMVKYYEDSRSILIIDPSTNNVLHSFVGTDNHSLKKEIKAKLIAMGAEFKEETRNTKGKDEVAQ
jgi:hypothetical protein